MEDGWAVILFYRGHWCPYCRQQLLDFHLNLARFREADVEVVALSSDAESEARVTVERLVAHDVLGLVEYARSRDAAVV